LRGRELERMRRLELERMTGGELEGMGIRGCVPDLLEELRPLLVRN